jgi:hypothetical protein
MKEIQFFNLHLFDDSDAVYTPIGVKNGDIEYLFNMETV